jgi:HNH endonuclease
LAPSNMVIKREEMTTWKTVPHFSGYAVTDWGQFRNAKTGRRLKSSPASGGHPKINLTADTGERKTVYTNVAVLTAFVGPLPDGATVIYGDRSRRNCRLTNLGIRTPTECVYFVEAGDGYRAVTVPLPADLRVLPVIGQCDKKHRLSLTGLPDDNTLFWGRNGNRVCRKCHAPNGLPECDPRHVYHLYFGAGKPPLDIIDSYQQQGKQAA